MHSKVTIFINNNSKLYSQNFLSVYILSVTSEIK